MHPTIKSYFLNSSKVYTFHIITFVNKYRSLNTRGNFPVVKNHLDTLDACQGDQLMRGDGEQTSMKDIIYNSWHGFGLYSKLPPLDTSLEFSHYGYCTIFVYLLTFVRFIAPIF